MAWRERLRDLIVAGGAFAATSGCSGTPLSSAKDAGQDFFVGGGCGNASPDPCICGRPEASADAAAECQAEIACQAEGGSWQAYRTVTPDGAVVSPHCILPHDAASGDGAVDR
jgi:hypothetical protein